MSLVNTFVYTIKVKHINRLALSFRPQQISYTGFILNICEVTIMKKYNEYSIRAIIVKYNVTKLILCLVNSFDNISDSNLIPQRR